MNPEMKHYKTVLLLSCGIFLFGLFAAAMGIFYTDSGTAYEYTSIRGKTVMIYGKGLYRHMSAEVAPQGIAQDYITLFAALPSLVISLVLAKKGGYQARFFLAGTLAYLM